MNAWPESWAGFPEDISVGRALVGEFRPFVVHLEHRGLAPKTFGDHLNNLWVIGGEFIRRFDYETGPRRVDARKLLLDAIAMGEAPLANGVSEAEQNAIDAMARQPLRFMMAHDTK